VTYDKSTSAALVAAALADEERMTPGPWELLERCSNTQPDEACGLTTRHRNKYGHIRGVFQSDSREECSHPVSMGDASAIASMRNRNLAMAEQLKAAMEEVDSLHRELERWRHGVTVEGDYVCPAELELTNAARTNAWPMLSWTTWSGTGRRRCGPRRRCAG
jgi:hypothetical protein